MWAIKLLNGSQAGKIIQLNEGSHSLGRSTQASIKISSASISKIHVKFTVTEDKIIISDNQSSNGVIVNGIKVQNKSLRPGDKFSLGEVLFDVIKLPKFVSIIPDSVPYQPGSLQTSGTNAIAQQDYSMIAAENNGSPVLATQSDENEENKPQLSLLEKAEYYIEEVALPGVYEYSYKFDLKYVIMTFVIFFVVLVTTVSVLPVIQVSRDFVIDESSRRADSLAKIIVQENRDYIINKSDISVNVRSVKNEPGVEKAFVVDAQDGHIIAPVNQRGRYSNIPFVQRARKKEGRYKQLLDNKIGVSRPILFNNPLTGEPAPAAYAIVIYNLDRVALDIPRTLSLMIQILIITLIAGALLYFFLYKVVTKPVFDLNDEINKALKEGSNNIELGTPTPIFQKLVSNINSALSRMSQEDDNDMQVGFGDKTMEAAELVEMFPVPAICLSPDNEMVIANNALIVDHPLFDESQIQDKYLDDFSDSSFIESIKDLLEKSADNPNIRHTNNLPSASGLQFEVSIKSIQEMGTISYYLICFTEIYDEESFEE